MAKPATRIGALQALLFLALLVVLGRAAQLQLVEGGRWRQEAEARRTRPATLAARRGAVFDRHGVALAITQESYHVGIAPNEVRDRRALVRAASASLGLRPAELERRLAREKWVYLHGPFSASAIEPLARLKGVHTETSYQRAYPAREVARPLVGILAADRAAGASGVEAAFDTLLTGVPGAAVYLKDRAGRLYESPGRIVREPVAGHDVYLTIDAELQEIAERGLAEALEELQAEAGDIVMLDPATGELLAVASRRRGGAATASAFTAPAEPGSTAKVFTAAALLMRGRVADDDRVGGEDGRWLMPVRGGRPRLITDTHREGTPLTLARALEVSSNIAMAKFAQRLAPEEQYETLRDFGFGTYAGTSFPGESPGRLVRPDRWSPDFSRASHAMGYEFSVTPVQLAAAYGAIANGGVLMAPSLVREVRGPEGERRWRHAPEPVRRVLAPEVAARLREYLRLAAGEQGTGARSQLRAFPLAGKTGTARRFRDGRYVEGEFVTWFASIFPADDPQLVTVVKIERPTRARSLYAGATAAPVTRAVLEDALAARRVAIDRARLARAARAEPGDGTAATLGDADVAVAGPERAAASAATARAEASADGPPPTRAVVALPVEPVVAGAPDTVAVPAVTGLALRSAAVVLHRAGLRVAPDGTGRVVRLSPAAGTAVPAGTTVTVWTEP